MEKMPIFTDITDIYSLGIHSSDFQVNKIIADSDNIKINWLNQVICKKY